jgi:ribonuclease P protein component
VTSKQLGSAVTRNRIRRQLREVMRHAHPFLVAGHDVAFIARVPVAGQPYQALAATVHGLLKQAGLWEVER